jgi:uncharacterized protein (TIGR03435 family)
MIFAGLAGTYDFTLEFVGTTLPPENAPNMPRADAARARTASDPGEGLPDIFVAVEKQLGLKLERIKDMSLDVLVSITPTRSPPGTEVPPEQSITRWLRSA